LKQLSLACLLLPLIFAGCDNAPPDEQLSAPASLAEDGVGANWSGFRDGFIDGYFEFNPGAGVRAGRHEFDGLLHDIQPAAIAREIAWLKQQSALAQAFDADRLSPDAIFERKYLRTVIDGELFYLEKSGFFDDNPVMYVGSIDPSAYLLLDYAPLQERMAAFIRHLANLPPFLEQMRANLKPPLARSLVDVSTKIVRGYAEFFETEVPTIFTGVDGESLWREFEAQNANAIAALNEAAAWLDAELERADDDFALGEERFLAMLRMAEGIDISVEELVAAGRADLERNRRALETACADFAPGVPLRDCLDQVQSIKPDGGPVETARRQLGSLKEFLRRWWPRPRRMRVIIWRISRFRARTNRACHRLTILHRRTRPGHRKFRTPIFRAEKRCCIFRCTKYGRVTFCSSSTPIAPNRRLAGYSRPIASPRVGHTMPSN